MRAFCFHSVRSALAIPAAKYWPSEKLHRQFSEYLTVDPTWFEWWTKQAQKKWGDSLVVTFDDAFQDCIVPAIQCAKLGIRTIVFVPTDHMGEVFPYAPYPVVTRLEAAYLALNGVELGSHSHSHTSWLQLSRTAVTMEVGASFAILKELLSSIGAAYENIPVAPPHGEFTESMGDLLVKNGVKEIFGTNLGPVGKKPAFKFRHLARAAGYLGAPDTKEIAWFY